jgi:spore germination protein
MFKKLLKKLNAQKKEKRVAPLELSAQLDKTVTSIDELFINSDDIVKRHFLIGNQIKATCYYIQGLCNTIALDVDVLKPLIQLQTSKMKQWQHSNDLLEQVTEEVLTVASYSVYDSFDEALLPFMSGDTLLIVDGVKKLIILATRGFESRSIEEPQSEIVIRGPRDGFTETLQTNIVLLRRRVRDTNLKVQKGELGRRSKRDFAILYIEGIANDDLIEEVRYRVACVDTDDVPETGTLEQLIEDNVLSPFPQITHTERPDKTASFLMNGQVILLVDGTPFALIVPVTFQQLLKSPEDYYERWLIGSLIRALRYFAAFISLFLPSLYIAMVSFHQGMIPTPLALSIAGSREGVPFPAFVEAMVMEVTFELLREAGNRLPRPIGQTVGIVGGIIIGDAAVQAGIVSPVMVIVVALTAISSFALPSYSVSISFRILRFVVMIAAGIFGLYGIIIVYILINIHLVGLRSFGTFYLSPFAPYRFLDWLDLVIRAPMSLLRLRTDEPRTLDNKKQN